LEVDYKKSLGFELKAYEWEVPMLINLFQIAVIVVGFVLFF